MVTLMIVLAVVVVASVQAVNINNKLNMGV